MAKRRAAWSEANLKLAMGAVEGGLTQRKAEELFQIPRRTLRNHIKSKVTEKRLGRPHTLTMEQEKELCLRIIRYSEIGLPVTASIVKSYVFEFCEKNNITSPFNKTKQSAGRYWFQNFLKRHPELSIRKAQSMNPGRAIKLNKHIVDDYFKKLKVVLEDHDLFDKPQSFIYNMDEKGCRLTLHHQQAVLAQKGTKRVHLVAPEHAENVTIVVSANASGTAIPPMIIYKGKRCKPEYCDGLPPDTLVCMSDKGSMTTDLFLKWIDHFAKFKTSGTVLLIFDGATSHIHPSIVDAAVSRDIILFCLPSNTTHELQPMDKSVFRSFEHYWDLEVLKYWRAHPDRSITKTRFGYICTPAYNKALSIGNIVNGFRSTGIYPFNPDAIPEVAFAPSLVTMEEVNSSERTEREEVFTELQSTSAAAEASPNPQSAIFCPEIFDATATSTPRKGQVEESNLVDAIDINDREDDSLHRFSVSFTEIMATPKIRRKKTSRKKSLTYKAQVMSKNLFSAHDTAPSARSSKAIKIHEKKEKQKQLLANKKTNAGRNASWFCSVCEEDTTLSMRQCMSCKVWFHEECVGLESDDEEDFICMDCN